MVVIEFSTILFAVSLGIALVLTPWIRKCAQKFGAIDYPDAHRKLHSEPIPKLGGIAVFCGFYFTVAISLQFADGPSITAAGDLAWRLFFPSLLVLCLGIVDDLWDVSPGTKIAVQLVAAGWICWSPDLRIASLWNPLGLSMLEGVGLLSIPLTIAWIILITNAFNIVDGMDGLASGVAFVATACLFVASIQSPDAFIPLLVAPLGGALVGFLRYNFNPASIFLGDSGSLWLGFQIAVLSIVGHNKSSTAVAVAAPLLSLALPLIEAGVSMLRRFLRGQAVWEADASHIHHQLLKKGISARRVAILLYIGSGMFGAASLLIGDSSDSNRAVGGVITLTLVALAWLGIQQLGYTEFTEVNKAFRRGFLYQRRIIQNSILVHKLLSDLKSRASLNEAWDLLVDVADRLGFGRVELVLENADLQGSGMTPRRLLVWSVEERFQNGAAEVEWSVVSVRLMKGVHAVARLELWRSRAEEPLHSELVELLDVIGEQFPRLLPHSPRSGSLAPDLPRASAGDGRDTRQ